MARQTEYLVIGLGRFGSTLARELTRAGAAVMGVDRSPEVVQRYADEINQTAVLDSTDEDALHDIDITSFKTVIVAISSDFEANLITTTILRQLGTQSIICKAQTERQRDILMRIGAHRVVLPDYEQGKWLAGELLHPTEIDRIDMGQNNRISMLKVPPTFAGKSVAQTALGDTYGVTLLLARRGNAITASPPADHVFQKGDAIVIIGPDEGCDRLSSAE